MQDLKSYIFQESVFAKPVGHFFYQKHLSDLFADSNQFPSDLPDGTRAMSPFWEVFFFKKDSSLVPKVYINYEEYKQNMHVNKYEFFLKDIHNYAKSLEYSLLVDREYQSTEDANYLEKVLVQVQDICILRTFLYLWDEILPDLFGEYFAAFETKYGMDVLRLRESLDSDVDLLSMGSTKSLYQEIFKPIWNDIKSCVLYGENTDLPLGKQIYLLKNMDKDLESRLGYTLSDMISDSRSTRLLRNMETQKKEVLLTSNYLRHSLESLDFPVWKSFDYLQKIMYLLHKTPWKTKNYAEQEFHYSSHPVCFWKNGNLELPDDGIIRKDFSDVEHFDGLSAGDIYALVSAFEKDLERKITQKGQEQYLEQYRNWHTFSAILARKFPTDNETFEIEFDVEFSESTDLVLKRYRSGMFFSDSNGRSAAAAFLIHEHPFLANLYQNTKNLGEYLDRLYDLKSDILDLFRKYWLEKYPDLQSRSHARERELLEQELNLYIDSVATLVKHDHYKKQHVLPLNHFSTKIPISPFSARDVAFRDFSTFRDLREGDIPGMEYPSMVNKLYTFFEGRGSDFCFKEKVWDVFAEKFSVEEFTYFQSVYVSDSEFRNSLHADFLLYVDYLEDLERGLYQKLSKSVSTNKDVLDAVVKYTAKQTGIYYQPGADLSGLGLPFTPHGKKPIYAAHLTSGKSFSSAWNKLVGRYNGDLNRFSDLTRATLEYGSISDLLLAVENLIKICKTPNAPVVKVRVVSKLGRTFEQAPKESGYRDIKCILTFENGETGEVQFHLSDVLQAKVGGVPLSDEVYSSLGLRVLDGQDPLLQQQVAGDVAFLESVLRGIGKEVRGDIEREIILPKSSLELISCDDIYHIRRKLYIPQWLEVKNISYLQFKILVEYFLEKGELSFGPKDLEHLNSILSPYGQEISSKLFSLLQKELLYFSPSLLTSLLQLKRIDEKMRLLETELYNHAWKKVMLRMVDQALLAHVKSYYPHLSSVIYLLEEGYLASNLIVGLNRELSLIEDRFFHDLLLHFLSLKFENPSVLLPQKDVKKTIIIDSISQFLSSLFKKN